ncbi:uncharacterized protein LOC120294395 [Eucalyptus grandis]|uniref:uncharacterized protein LOC120294395 n=1 Tax=Eucalyptus grandis TaxID=71139 RepID=UPI00192E9ADB|nr:uncharacterized protein LOC120294395 [Eucalyptus grandis]
MAGVGSSGEGTQVHGEELRRGDCRGSVWACVAEAASGRSDHELQPAGALQDGGRPRVAAMRLGTGEREASSRVRDFVVGDLGFAARGTPVLGSRLGCDWVTGGLGSTARWCGPRGDAGAEVRGSGEADHRQSGHTAANGESLGEDSDRHGGFVRAERGAGGWLKRRGPRAEQRTPGGKDRDPTRVQLAEANGPSLQVRARRMRERRGSWTETGGYVGAGKRLGCSTARTCSRRVERRGFGSVGRGADRGGGTRRIGDRPASGTGCDRRSGSASGHRRCGAGTVVARAAGESGIGLGWERRICSKRTLWRR